MLRRYFRKEDQKFVKSWQALLWREKKILYLERLRIFIVLVTLLNLAVILIALYKGLRPGSMIPLFFLVGLLLFVQVDTIIKFLKVLDTSMRNKPIDEVLANSKIDDG